jgi:hypothetical protein
MNDARLIGSDSEEGRYFVRSLSATGLPAGLFELGFRDVAHFWLPWCVAVVDGEIASIAFAARLSDLGAELGLATAKDFRGQGSLQRQPLAGHGFPRFNLAFFSIALTVTTFPRSALQRALDSSFVGPACGSHSLQSHSVGFGSRVTLRTGYQASGFYH